MKVNYEDLKKNCGLDFKGAFRENDLLFYIKATLWNLKTHNKNYNKKQEEEINTLNDIFECID